ncbi:hypothetical protein Droror1_Dr00001415 [Drosera rotundifolia]
MEIQIENQPINLNEKSFVPKIAIKPIIILADDDDDDLKIIPSGTSKIDPINVEDDFDRNHSIPCSKSKTQIEYQVVDDYDDNDDIRVLPFKPLPSYSSKTKRWGLPGGEFGECSSSSGSSMVNRKRKMFACEICADDKFHYECFNVDGCSHSFCFDCVRSYIVSKLDNGIPQVECPVPDCHGLIEPEYCRFMLDSELFARWGKLLCESVIVDSQKFYCPFKDCSALLIDDGGEAVTMTECPDCKRLFCAQCMVAWHDGIGCEEYRNLNEEEGSSEGAMLRDLAKNKKWQRCPSCKFYVERKDGCNYMMCRCGTAFCYGCGDKLINSHSHRCPKCSPSIPHVPVFGAQPPMVPRRYGSAVRLTQVLSQNNINFPTQASSSPYTAGILPPMVWPSQGLPNVMLPQGLPQVLLPQGLPQNQVRTSGSVRNVLSPPYMVGMIPPFGRLLQGLPQGQPPQGLPQVLPPQESSLNQASTRGSVRGVLSRPNIMIPSFGRPLQGSQQGQPSQGPPQL